jgi:hypothetical protein
VDSDVGTVIAGVYLLARAAHPAKTPPFGSSFTCKCRLKNPLSLSNPLLKHSILLYNRP